MPLCEDDKPELTDVEGLRRREQTGLDTLVVYAVKAEC